MTSTTLPFKMPDRTSSQKNLSLDELSRLEHAHSESVVCYEKQKEQNG